MRTNEDLATAIQAGESEAMEQLWTQCRGYICQQANRWAQAWKDRPSYDVDDFIQSGYIAMCEAVKAYQADKGSFLNILAYNLKTEFCKVAGCRTNAQRKEPLNNAVSLDAPAYNDENNETSIGDTIPFHDPGFEEVEEAMQKAHIAGIVKEAVCSLPERQRRAIEGHYLQELSYSEVADKMHITSGNAKQIAKAGLQALRRGRYAHTLSELLWGQRNLYKYTGYFAWKETGCSVQERSVIWKEEQEKRYRLKNKRRPIIRYCVDVLGMDQAQAERLFPA